MLGPLRQSIHPAAAAFLFTLTAVANPAHAFLGTLTAVVGGAILSNKVADDAERVIGRAERLVDVTNLHARDRLTQVDDILSNTEVRVQKILTETGALIDGRLNKIDSLSEAVKNRLKKTIEEASRQILRVEATRLSPWHTVARDTLRRINGLAGIPWLKGINA